MGREKETSIQFEQARRAKIGGTLFKNVFLIIWSYWLNLHFLRISIRVCKNNHIDKSRDNSCKDNPSIRILDVDNVDYLGIYIPNVDKDRKVDNPSRL